MTDEAHFDITWGVNKHNCRFWAEENPKELHHGGLQPVQVTVWCATAAGSIIGPYYFEENNVTVRVTSECYLDMLQNFPIPELRRKVTMPANTGIQQDGATCHTARIVM